MPRRGLELWIVAGWSGLTALQLGLIAPLRHAWAFNFWQYLSQPAVALLIAFSVPLLWPCARDRLGRGLEQAGRALGRLPAPARDGLVFGVLSIGFWLARERQLFGDSYLFINAAAQGWNFVVPDLGASFLLIQSGRLGPLLGMPGVQAAQLMVCLIGGAFFVLLLRAFSALTGSLAGGAWLTALAGSGGLARIFAGHVEVYAWQLLALALYLWLACEHLDGRRGVVPLALALGLAIWMHASGVLLIPSFLVLLWLRRGSGAPRAVWLRHACLGLALAALPALAFFAAMAALGLSDDLARAWHRAADILGLLEQAEITYSWNRLPWRPPLPRDHIGIDYVVPSWSHTKFILNHFYLLAPFALPVLLVLGRNIVRRAATEPRDLFLLSALAICLPYAFMARPLWGPFDWDMFSVTAFFLLALAGRALLRAIHEQPASERGAALLGFIVAMQLLYVAGPFLRIGVHSERTGGPFVRGGFYSEIQKRDPDYGRIAPWL